MKKIILIFLSCLIFGEANYSIPALANSITTQFSQDHFKISDNEQFNASLYSKEIDDFVKIDYQKNTDLRHLFQDIKEKIASDILKFGESNENQIRNLWGAYFLYDFAFVGKSIFYSSVMNMINSGGSVDYGNFPETQKRIKTTTNSEDGTTQKLVSYYVDQKSDKTVVIHGGFRGNWLHGNDTPELRSFYDKGYNLLIVDSRSTGESEGQYVTYGAYESEDILKWVNQEVKDRPRQKIILYGGSMGAASMMSTLSYPMPNNVKGLIENCGFSNIRSQLLFTYGEISEEMSENSFLIQMLWGIDLPTELHLDSQHTEELMQTLNDCYIKPFVNLDIDMNLPIKGMINTPNLPKLFIHGEADNIVPFDNLQILMNANKSYENKIIVPGAGHGEAQTVDPKGYERAISNYLDMVFNAKVITSYKDDKGNKIQPDIILNGTYGNEYHTSAKNIKHYFLQKIKGRSSGRFSEKEVVVTYFYKKSKRVHGDGASIKLGCRKSSNKKMKKKIKLPQTGEKSLSMNVLSIIGLVILGLILLRYFFFYLFVIFNKRWMGR